jgi:hypothetical protein
VLEKEEEKKKKRERERKKKPYSKRVNNVNSYHWY